MADQTSTPQPQGGRGGGGREPGGFRIRLSDNEMRGARSVQEAFRLRSTVSVLGFCVRTMAQLLEEGKLDALVEEMRSQAPARGPRRDGGDNRGPRPERARSRVDPFARPSRPKPAEAAPAPEATEEPSPVDEPAADGPVTEEASTGEAAAAEASSEAAGQQGG